ncbi:hypothetical protein CP8484711_1379, partial [Chlamydia psittaci 84-8471/1]
ARMRFQILSQLS